MRHQPGPWKLLTLLQILVLLPALVLACAAPTVAPTPTATKPGAASPVSSPQADQKAPPATAKPAKPTGELVIVLPDFGAEKWDPSQTAPVLSTYQAGGPMYETLFTPWPPDGEPRPLLLESGQVAADGLSWTLKLRDGIRFSNGDPMAAEDVKFSLDRYRSPASVSSQAVQLRKAIKDIVAVDRLTTRVVLNDPQITLPTSLSGILGNEGIILPKKYIEQVGWDGFEKNAIGSGPYKRTEYRPGESITYEAVENHWRATPSFAKLRFLKVPEEQSRVAMLKSGQADLVKLTPEATKEVARAGLGTIVVPFTAQWMLEFYGGYGQYPPSPISKLEVRKALALAINRQEILDGLYAGAGKVAAIAPPAPGFSLGAPKDLQPYPYDPAEAKRLLAQAGYPNGFEMTFYATNFPACLNPQQIAQAVASYWERIGVKTNIQVIDYAVFRPLFSGQKHDPKIVGTVSNMCTNSSPVALTQLSTYLWSKGVVKVTDVADAEIDKAQSAKSVDELVKYSEAALRKVYDNYSVIPLLHGGNTYGISKKVGQLPVIAGADQLTSWLVQEKP